MRKRSASPVSQCSLIELLRSGRFSPDRRQQQLGAVFCSSQQTVGGLGHGVFRDQALSVFFIHETLDLWCSDHTVSKLRTILGRTARTQKKWWNIMRLNTLYLQKQLCVCISITIQFKPMTGGCRVRRLSGFSQLQHTKGDRLESDWKHSVWFRRRWHLKRAGGRTWRKCTLWKSWMIEMSPTCARCEYSGNLPALVTHGLNQTSHRLIDHSGSRWRHQCKTAALGLDLLTVERPTWRSSWLHFSPASVASVC